MKLKNKIYDFLLFCGDIHSKIDIIPNFLKVNGLKNCAVFQVGDFGIGFDNEHKENRRMLYLNKRMSVYDSDLFVIRGNHDNPRYFNGNFNMSNLFLLDDYSIININNINVLCIGGAISVDRTERKGYWNPKKTHDYWVNENIIFDENKLKTIQNIDIVVTHSAPGFCYPYTKSEITKWIETDEKLNEDVNIERYNLSEIYNILSKNNNIKNWYYGHFHKNHTTYNDNTIFKCIGVNNFEEYVLEYKF